MNITLDPKTTIENVERLQTKFRGKHYNLQTSSCFTEIVFIIDAVVTLLNSSHGDAIDDRLSILLSKAKDIKNLSKLTNVSEKDLWRKRLGTFNFIGCYIMERVDKAHCRLANVRKLAKSGGFESSLQRPR